MKKDDFTDISSIIHNSLEEEFDHIELHVTEELIQKTLSSLTNKSLDSDGQKVPKKTSYFNTIRNLAAIAALLILCLIGVHFFREQGIQKDAVTEETAFEDAVSNDMASNDTFSEDAVSEPSASIDPGLEDSDKTTAAGIKNNGKKTEAASELFDPLTFLLPFSISSIKKAEILFPEGSSSKPVTENSRKGIKKICQSITERLDLFSIGITSGTSVEEDFSSHENWDCCYVFYPKGESDGFSLYFYPDFMLCRKSIPDNSQSVGYTLYPVK